MDGNLVDLTCTEFVAQTFSKTPVPGGGSVAALVGTLGVGLEGMVCSLTQGKKKYAQYEEDIVRMAAKIENLKNRLLSLVDEDAKSFYPLSQVYSMNATTSDELRQKENKMQEVLKKAIQPPIEIIRECYQAAQFLEELSKKGSVLALSDVGCAAQLLRSATHSAWLNVLINLKGITDELFIQSCNAELLPMIDSTCHICDMVYEKISLQLQFSC
jgi:formiminotetrahydrofolate cyclodeaminase